MNETPESARKILQLVDRDCDLAVVIMPQADILREPFNRFSGIGDAVNLSHFLPHVMSHAEVALHVAADSSIAVRPGQESESVRRESRLAAAEAYGLTVICTRSHSLRTSANIFAPEIVFRSLEKVSQCFHFPPMSLGERFCETRALVLVQWL